MTSEPTVRSRREGCVWGMLVGDAYCLGSHWIYDRDAFEARFPEAPAGFDAPAPGHYHEAKAPGALTHYGEGGLLLLESLARRGVDRDAYGHAVVAFYGRSDCRSYVDKPTKHLLAARRELPADAPFDQGAEDAQNITTSRLAPLVVRLAGDPRLMLHVDAFTRVLQDDDRAVAYACAHARLLEHLLEGATLDQALDRLLHTIDRRTATGAEIGAAIDGARAARDEPVGEATERFGLSCPLIKAFPAALQASLRHEDAFEDAIRATALARGDNASRAMLVGSWLGARLGIDAVPASWRSRLSDRTAVESALAGLLQPLGRAATLQ